MNALSQIASLRLSGATPAPPAAYVAWSHLSWGLVWAALTPAVFGLASRLPLRRLREPRAALLHAAATTVLPGVVVVVWYVVFGLGLGAAPTPGEIRLVLAPLYPHQMLTYLEVLAVAFTLGFLRAAGEAEARTSRLSGALASARAASLKTQLHPHFLFNTLNGVMPLISTRPREAERMLGQLGELFRLSLADTGPLTSLAAELDFVSRYLDIQRARFGSRLSVAVRPDGGLDDALVPPLILQPLVENALRHSLAPRPGPGSLDVRARQEGNALVLEVVDDGLGLDGAPASTRGSGLGLASVRSRLRHLYGSEGALSVSRRPEGGVSARIEVPLRRETGAAA